MEMYLVGSTSGGTGQREKLTCDVGAAEGAEAPQSFG